eukprot:CAMPEP_0114458514 /NCGR_PEP_ID=MMETSP0104-20121206/4725_1 /TAXON_ID=37642 ORGANISM="Paraphysomonas imperforata, Strain PA2" /NCGR_SAMPLE_ID=MMETSP0104 /ASSEMBLY_ACC=CAM_ASM_000202 /LENGTH=46 /DNA_ID= /DNA_START= /DNA_END= /DNA_ORIENTATION=
MSSTGGHDYTCAPVHIPLIHMTSILKKPSHGSDVVVMDSHHHGTVA